MKKEKNERAAKGGQKALGDWTYTAVAEAAEKKPNPP
jgi:hypothetical protein